MRRLTIVVFVVALLAVVATVTRADAPSLLRWEVRQVTFSHGPDTFPLVRTCVAAYTPSAVAMHCE